MVQTVEDYLRRFCEEERIPFEVYMETWLRSHVCGDVSQRYERLACEVALALPHGWDDHAEWTVELGRQEDPRGYACTRADEEGAGETLTNYIIKIFPSMMDRLSDSACRWVFAHELGHVASRLRFGSIVIRGKPHTKLVGDVYVEAPGKDAQEDAANKIALGRGFDRELQTFLREDGGLEPVQD
jgi:hypothetical protein